MRTILLFTVGAASLFAAGELSNRRAPSFSLPDFTGRQHDILDYRGKLLIIDFMRTNCPHCAVTTDALREVEQKYRDRINVLSVVNYPDDNPQSASDYSKLHKLTSPILFDCGSVAVSYLKNTSFATPHLFLVDASGNIRNDFAWTDENEQLFDAKNLAAVVEKLLADSAAPPAKKSAPRKK